MGHDYITVNTVSAPNGAVVIIFGALDDVDEYGLGPQSYDDQMMIVTPMTQGRDIWQKVKSSKGVREQDESATYDAIIEALRRAGIMI